MPAETEHPADLQLNKSSCNQKNHPAEPSLHFQIAELRVKWIAAILSY